MRMPQEVRARPGYQKSASTSLPAPIGGLNARDSVAAMRPTDATLMENLFPKTTSVDVRNGYTAWATFTGICQSILVYTGPTATKVFPCVKNGSTYSIFDGTSAGAVGAAAVGGSGPTVQALTSTRFDYVNIATTGGSFMSVVNGADPPLEYNGSAWSASATTDGTGSTSDYFTVALYAKRLWYGVKNSLRVRYLPVDSKSGAATDLNLGAVFKLGGYLNSIITVTDQNNSGLTDYIGFLSSEGEVLAYTGTDPSSVATWQLAAHFRIGRPVIKGNRCWEKWGTDALVLCADGVYPLRKAITANNQSAGLAVSEKIRNLVNADLVVHGARYGWTVRVHPTGGKLIVNVPTAEDSAAYQYVMNTETGAWCQFTGWNGFVFEVARDTLWMGMSGKMVKADSGTADDSSAIAFQGRQAYNYFGSRGRIKHMKLLRPIMASTGEFSFNIAVDVDYDDTTISYLRTVSGGSGDPWGGVWDAAWGGGIVRVANRYGVVGAGNAVAVKVKGQTNGVSLSWTATDAIYELGGALG